MASNSCLNRVFRSSRPLLNLAKRNRNDRTGVETSVKSFSTSDQRAVHRSLIPDIDIPNVSLTDFLFPRFDKFSKNVAMVDGTTEKSYTYTELKENAIKVASALTRMGYKKGDVLAIYSTNSPEFTMVMLGAAAAGIIVTTMNPAYTSGELARHLEHSGASSLFTIPALVGTVKDALETDKVLKSIIKNIVVFGTADGHRPFSTLLEDDGKAFPENISIDPMEDVVVLPYSSGTTGLPKGVMLTHSNIVSNLLQFRPLISVNEEDTCLGVLPFFHIYGLSPVMMGVLQDGGKLVTQPRFDPEMFLKALQGYKVTQAHLVPPIILFLAKHPVVSKFDLSSITKLISGAAPLGDSLTEEVMERLKAPVCQGYGMTETSPVIHVDTVPNTRGSVGKVVPNTLCKIVCPDTDTQLDKVGEVGEICVKGPQVMKGYLHNIKATEDIIRDGWLHTGDIGYVKDNGSFVITDRLKELIKYKGYQVAPAELEDLLLNHPAVQDVAVIGMPDDEAGEVPRAYIVKKPNSDVSAGEISQYVEDNAAYYKKLRGGVQFIDLIPKAPSGKILRRILKESLTQD
ncbi:uncharacterized protein LOC134710116 [Mytilus trossulus]|uniref:uncharacterized protein LOC134710116 n=1 Tax=Mytilus trossulus TaxID=6551 RepID=UPI00300675A8